MLAIYLYFCIYVLDGSYANDIGMRSAHPSTIKVDFKGSTSFIVTRHVRSWTPCLNAVHEAPAFAFAQLTKAIFGEAMREAVGPYCCAQFVVQDAKAWKVLLSRPAARFENGHWSSTSAC